jgi:hypothetical protein
VLSHFKKVSCLLLEVLLVLVLYLLDIFLDELILSVSLGLIKVVILSTVRFEFDCARVRYSKLSSYLVPKVKV